MPLHEKLEPGPDTPPVLSYHVAAQEQNSTCDLNIPEVEWPSVVILIF